MTTGGWLAVLARLFLIMLFAAAALGKLRSRAAAARALATVLPVPDRATPALLAGIIGGEAIIVLVLLGSAVTGAWLALGFTLAATVPLVALLVRGRTAQCLCFGGAPHRISWLDAARNGCVAVVCGAVLVAGDTPLHVSIAEIAILAGLATIGLFVTTGSPRIAAALR